MVLCSICLENDEKNFVALKCGHIFHFNCVVRWNCVSKNCPNCRIDLHVNTILYCKFNNMICPYFLVQCYIIFFNSQLVTETPKSQYLKPIRTDIDADEIKKSHRQLEQQIKQNSCESAERHELIMKNSEMLRATKEAFGSFRRQMEILYKDQLNLN